MATTGNAAHTPGPWRADFSTLGGGPWILTDADDRGAHEIAWSDADYRLIAAAPDLLAALEDIVKGGLLAAYGMSVGQVQEDRARAAILKAREVSR